MFKQFHDQLMAFKLEREEQQRAKKYSFNNLKMKRKKLEMDLIALKETQQIYDKRTTENDNISNFSQPLRSRNNQIYFPQGENGDHLSKENWNGFFSFNSPFHKHIAVFKNKDMTLTNKFIGHYTGGLENKALLRQMKNLELENSSKKNQIIDHLQNLSNELDDMTIFQQNLLQSEIVTSAFLTEKPLRVISKINSQKFIQDTHGNIEQKLDHIKHLHHNSSDVSSLQPCSSSSNIKKIEFTPLSSGIVKKVPRAPVNQSIPHHKKRLPVVVSGFAQNLNNELVRISKSYGKLDSASRFIQNPITQYHYDQPNYLAYRAARASENSELFRPKLKPLQIEKDNGFEMMSIRIFKLQDRNNKFESSKK